MVRFFLLIIISVVIFSSSLFAGYLFIGPSKPAENIVWGMNFSQKQSENLGLDWKENYSALISDIHTKRIKVAAYWDLIERERGKYDFSDLDWQIKTAEKNNVKVLLAIGMKSPRWPECHIPEWAKILNEEERQKEILNFLEEIVLRYNNSSSMWAFQVENEPFFAFGECLAVDKEFLQEEISRVKSVDSSHRPIIISDTGEWSLWFDVANFGDIIGITLYKKVWFTTPGFIKKIFQGNSLEKSGFYLEYLFPPVFYQRKAQIIKEIFGKDVVCTELQVEPWGPKLLQDSSLEEQQKSIDFDQFKKNIEFAKRTGLSEFYLWGGEWMYWMKEKQNRPEFWEEAKKLFTP